MTKILLVEDNADLAFGLRAALEFEGYDVALAADGLEACRKVEEVEPDLILLDLMLPGLDGYEVLSRLRKDGDRTPVLILTARGEEADVLSGFDRGADDYVTKPFSTAELLARVRALLRRARGDGREGRLRVQHFGDVEVNPASGTVIRDGEPVTLSPKEFDLLVALLRREGAVASRTELLGEVWAYANPEIETRTVDVHIAELRRKLEADPANPRHILTVRKKGYRLQT
ncbi:MAG TPA: response regulator transcription factor [Longimicrobiales bacterium]|nr:response regulator transcription factor [Longimicrobiales bacterium]